MPFARFQSLDIWSIPDVRDQLQWYRDVSLNGMPAKYLICRSIPCQLDLKAATEEELWSEHERLTGIFLRTWRSIRHEEIKLVDLPKASPSLLDLNVELAKRMLTHCNFCRWNCRVDRSQGTKHGTCQLESVSRVGSYFHHRGEEIVFRGNEGSGTIFFTSCNMRCGFCVHPDTFVITQRGPVRISQIFNEAAFEKQIHGGQVRFPENLYTFSHDSRIVKVTKVFKHNYRGNLIVIKPLKAPPLLATPGHEILASESPRSSLLKVRAGQLSPGHWLAIPRIVYAFETSLEDLEVSARFGSNALSTCALPPDSVLDGQIGSGRDCSVTSPKQNSLVSEDEYAPLPIHRIRRVPYSGPVFNLEVGDSDHTYTANFIGVGNCQNGDISRDKGNGIPISPKLLALMAWQLRMEGCHNINFVGGEPTIHLHTIVEAISLLDSKKPSADELLYIEQAKSDSSFSFRRNGENAFYEGEFNVPILWNSNFFMTPETMQLLRTMVDVWLPDFKFGNDKCAIHLSRTPWYFETISRNHKLVYDWGEDMVIRHLIMPNHVECCTKPVLEWIKENIPDALINIMDQYRPECFADPCGGQYDPKYSDINRFPTKTEILESFRYARTLGLSFEPLTYEKNMTGLKI